MSTQLFHTSELTDVDWPEEAVFIVDEAIPDRFQRGLAGPSVVVDAGENLKRLDRIEQLADSVLQLRSTRPLTLVGVGGGAVGDAVGFLASTLWRGVGLWHVPTTLLAMVDSAHGGKTAVNLAGRKNQLGSFYPADAVVLCTGFLETLPFDLREEGFVELLKALWLARPNTLEVLDEPGAYNRILAGEVNADRELWQRLLTEAVDAKYDVVEEDPKEQTGHRRILNLGHTAGHGLEALYGLAHGRAVAWGLAACALLSHRHAALDARQRDRLLDHLDPLLVALPRHPDEVDRRRFIENLRRDKKREDGQLISILLDAAGQPVQTTELSPEDWWQAVQQAQQIWRDRPHVFPPGGSGRSEAKVDGGIELPTSKSHANRAAIIAHLRAGTTPLAPPSPSSPADVVDLRRALQRIDTAGDTSDVTVHAGEGGTTARFLLAVAATRRATTTLQLAEPLRNRPHTPLVDALEAGGATITETDQGFRIVGWEQFPDQLTVDATASSQFASALALLSASGNPLRLKLDGPVASRPYFEMTLNMLADAGVEHTPQSEGSLQLEPTDRLHQPHHFQLPPDPSSAVVWQAINALDDGIPLPAIGEVDHPDTRFPDIVNTLKKQKEKDSGIGSRKSEVGNRKSETSGMVIDLSESPDLAPVLAALAARLPISLTVTGAAHLRHKESNRIDDLAAAFSEVGVTIEPTDDGFVVPTEPQQPTPGATFDPRGDHRLAMAAAVLAHGAASITIGNARCVTKSYPELWRHLRRITNHRPPTT